MNQIAVVNQGGKVSTERVIVLPGEDFDALIDRPGYHLCKNGDLERREPQRRPRHYRPSVIHGGSPARCAAFVPGRDRDRRRSPRPLKAVRCAPS